MSILATPVHRTNLASTVGGVLAEVLCRVIDEGDSFDPKRPLGSSDWMDCFLYEPLQAAGWVSGQHSDMEADRLLKEAIRESLGQ